MYRNNEKFKYYNVVFWRLCTVKFVLYIYINFTSKKGLRSYKMNLNIYKLCNPL